MRALIFFTLVCCLAATGCKDSNTNQPAVNSQQDATEAPTSSSNSSQPNVQPSPPQTAIVKPKLDACALLTSSEIRSVQGEGLQETKLSGQILGGYNISQCFYTLPTFTNSISLMVAQKGDGAGAKDPKEFWKENFHEGAKEKSREGEGKKDPPQKITGVGDEAFWTSNRVTGAIYVLKGDAYVRLSIGGQPNDASKRRSKALAQKAIMRLQ